MQYRQRKKQALAHQDEVLDQMHSSVKQLWSVNQEINHEFDEHERIISKMEDDVEVSQPVACTRRS